MNNAQILSALAELPAPDYMHTITLDAPFGTGTSYSARTVVLLLARARRKHEKLIKAANALLALDLENDGATCDWGELQSALADLRASIDSEKPNARDNARP